MEINRGRKGKDGDSENDSKRIEAVQKDLSYISLILPQSPRFSHPQRRGLLFHLFHFYFGRVPVIYTVAGSAVGV